MKLRKRFLQHLKTTILLQNNFERELNDRGYHLVAGVDEAGRGPLAGPVVAAACILPLDLRIEGLNDSKKLTPKTRAELFLFLTSHPAIQFGIAECSAQEIDEINILQASLEAMKRALLQLSLVHYALIDGNKCPNIHIPCQAIIKGDSLSPSIAAASILAKETRDAQMLKYHEQYPQYNFAKHKGYPTKEHIEALAQHGPAPIHRRSFGPVNKLTSSL
ncbi:MAG: ribonuclease HII [Chlamydiales bacterium]|nr:ribonuclease HII [Chlamydiales bacterium]